MKDRILGILKENKGEFVSGEHLGDILDVSRTAVWKCINQLRNEGCIIETSSRKGYKLLDVPDMLSRNEIAGGLSNSIIGREIILLEVVGSTNDYAKRLASEGAPEGTVVLAERQTAGKGRLGRQWASAGRKGIWLSVILRPNLAPEEVQSITLAASVAAAAAIGRTAGVSAGIKWPNDIILDGRKVCGILTEMNSETERVNYLVIGIGINVYQDSEDFPEEIRSTAVSLAEFSKINSGKQAAFSRNALIRALLEELEALYVGICSGKVAEVIERWKKYSLTLGKEIKVTGRGGEYRATALDVTSDGKLLVRDSGGVLHEIVSGEVSVRGILGYLE